MHNVIMWIKKSFRIYAEGQSYDVSISLLRSHICFSKSVSTLKETEATTVIIFESSSYSSGLSVQLNVVAVSP